MNTIVIALVATLPLALCVPSQAQGPTAPTREGRLQMQESGPAVVGRDGTTTVPTRNQAVVPIPHGAAAGLVSGLPGRSPCRSG